MPMSPEKRVGLFFALGLAILLVILEMVGREGIFRRGYHLRARFDRVTGLRVGDAVKLAGVDVGNVSSFTTLDRKVEVLLRVHQGTVVREDATASIKQTSFLGGTHVDISFGTPTARALQDGEELRTSEAGDLGSIVGSVSEAAGQLSQVLAENREGLRGTVASLRTVASRLEKGEGTLGKLLTDDALFRDLKTAAGNIASLTTRIEKGEGALGKLMQDDGLYANLKNTAANLDRITTKVERGEGTVGKLVNDDSLYTELKQTLADLRGVADRLGNGDGTLGKLINDSALYDEAKEAAASLNSILKKVERGEGTLGKLLTDDSLFYSAKDGFRKLGKTADQLRDQGALSTIGIALGVFF
ncbi:MAG: MCE family protein [candidate division NC10 bacterium]|nr:MCE family protein [candidate division NC10 bacterium]